MLANPQLSANHPNQEGNLLIRNILLCAMLTLGPVSLPAIAQVNINVEISVAPPASRYEVVPAPRSGYAWAPGYWQWEGKRHVWIAGRWIEARQGAYWVPDSWEQKGNGRHHYKPGHWMHHAKWDKGHQDNKGKGKGKGHDKG